MFQSGRRLFSLACLGIILTGIAHGLAHFSPAPSDPAWSAVEASMRSYSFTMAGASFTPLDVLRSLSLTMSITLLWLGIAGLIVSGSDASLRVIRRLLILGIVGVGALASLYAYYRIVPPLVWFVGVEVLLLMGLIGRRARRAEPASKAA
jgi:hypothetical protein